MTKRIIAPHKGGRTERTEVRMTPTTKELLKSLNISAADLLEWAVHEWNQKMSTTNLRNLTASNRFLTDPSSENSDRLSAASQLAQAEAQALRNNMDASITAWNTFVQEGAIATIENGACILRSETGEELARFVNRANGGFSFAVEGDLMVVGLPPINNASTYRGLVTPDYN